MKVSFKGKTITSAAYEVMSCGTPLLIINTHQRRVHYQSTHSTSEYIRFNYKYNSYVELTAENEDDIKVLSRWRFESNDDEQKVILFFNDKAL